MSLTEFDIDAAVQICLAAEKCGSLGFDVRSDMWNSSEGFLCDVNQSGQVTYWSLLKKVQHTWLHIQIAPCIYQLHRAFLGNVLDCHKLYYSGCHLQRDVNIKHLRSR